VCLTAPTPIVYPEFVRANDDKSVADILYVEDDSASGRLVQSIVEREGYRIKVVCSGQEFLKVLGESKPDLVLADLQLPDASGLDLLAKSRYRYPDVPVIMVTASNTVSDVVSALKGGATDYVTKPVEHQRLVVSLANALKMLRQQQDLAKLRSELNETYKLEHIIGNTPAMENVREMIRQAAPSDATVIILGESGTGKELVARALHYSGPRFAKPFTDVNCAALTDTLIESELFGHERGAFTSAISRRRGKFEQANGGSLFLDEIGDMPLPTQAKILRVLQERTFERVGGEDKISVNVRVICATNRNLEQAVQSGSFRSDLFYRVNTFAIEVPPLRERLADVPELAQHFLAVVGRSGKYPARSISDSAMAALLEHRWPGNVRELQNTIERALLICRDEEIQVAHLPPAVLQGKSPGVEPVQIAAVSNNSRNLVEAVEAFERSLILDALEKSDWNKTQAARVLGVTRRILSYKVTTLGIDKAITE